MFTYSPAELMRVTIVWLAASTVPSLFASVASARVATMNKIESIKQGAISFGNRVKDNVVNTYNKLNSIEVNFDFLRNSTSRLQKRPVTELEEMFRSELNGLEA